MSKTKRVRDPSVKFRHYRFIENGAIVSHGGATLAFKQATDQDGTVFFVGAVARCNPRDNYCKEYGRAKAYGRLEQYSSTNYTDDNELFFYRCYSASSLADFAAHMDTEMSWEGIDPR